MLDGRAIEGSWETMNKIATIECPVCDAWVEVYPTEPPGQHKFGWMPETTLSARLPPLQRCRFVGKEIERLYPGFFGGGISN